jgi:hypothetical protein
MALGLNDKLDLYVRKFFYFIHISNIYILMLLLPRTGKAKLYGGCPGFRGVLETIKNKFQFKPKQTETRSVSRLFQFVL